MNPFVLYLLLRVVAAGVGYALAVVAVSRVLV